MNLLDIRNLSIVLKSATNPILAVDRVSLTMKEGEVRGLVGESGSGKSLLAQAIIGVLDEKWHVDADRFHWRGKDLMRLSVDERKAIISKDVAMIFQEPMACLDPTMTIGMQLTEAVDGEQLTGYFWQKNQQRKETAISLLHKVGIKQHKICLKKYPHQLNEALCQRVMIAMALAKRPILLIADEPTAAMESTNQGQIFRLLASLNQLKNMSILLISHDLENVTHWTNTITVMYSGQFVEAGTTKHIFEQPFHPYTRALVDSSPKSNSGLPAKSRLMALPGSIPILQHLPIGCRLGPRCPRAQQACVVAPKVTNYHGHQFSCHFSLKGSY
ncbi:MULTISPECIES: oligopeptide/dipeptide ABC transporter ATP-binding protein [unclassified Colwellia]|jgi:cationic peptide transport system ATP-binding protein|uniref:peptide ABC transporter ATP-binding protein n=1 Tax=unclassified Colwellia TaxID=196834 RepID=UPI0015F3F3A4|nr:MULTISPECIES: oligopeptide/dipeptide ABC transporter ATP-binding protein [unclassified Colwellia]MBA6363277.1 ATP-binding cassette domain-containing protein [Colwellia sp. BRX8-8]MBA6338143.1 ATP-binding cassette domain-containing protein [Colwellia sp. BRX8-7]MBA6347220.1 ATP-binding cassette domain-containing protein [Colwellia sp. BRX8-9]MBA6351117.1 ATP-binding cassette domain-containing protein [Colwellia sp. BRX9-1]MBA6355547.1 ATP-binding cassette domain-containing protein [Colwellia